MGSISDPGFSGTPGLNQELFDTSTVFTKWCNSLGGINGRLIKDDLLDAALFNYNAKITTACAQDFALVGGGGVFDNTGQKTRLSCLLPDYPAYLVTPEARGADLTTQVTPGPNNSLNFGLARYLADKYPDSVNNVGYLTPQRGHHHHQQEPVRGGGAQARLRQGRVRRPVQRHRRTDLDAHRPGHQGRRRQGPVLRG